MPAEATEQQNHHGFPIFASLSETFLFPALVIAVFPFWFNIDDWSYDRCSNEWENSRLHWSKMCKIFYDI